MLLDSNIIIYAVQPQHALLRATIASYPSAVSAVSMVEVLGYHRLTPAEASLLRNFFASVQVLPVEAAVIQKAIALRQRRKLSLGDLLIAATALTHNLTLMTHNTVDFAQVPGLNVFDPLP